MENLANLNVYDERLRDLAADKRMMSLNESLFVERLCWEKWT